MQKQSAVKVDAKAVVGSMPGRDELGAGADELKLQIEQIKKLRGEMAGLENELKQGDPAKVVELIKVLGAKKQELAKLNKSVELLKQPGSLSHQDRSQLVGKPEAAKAHELEPVEEKDSESGKLGL